MNDKFNRIKCNLEIMKDDNLKIFREVILNKSLSSEDDENI